ncbi:MAG: DUF481 domain-containing protein, partial [Myxococcales bacterium]|nr:DUF481 domain-containing protein [Myxococcales bacterium]
RPADRRTPWRRSTRSSRPGRRRSRGGLHPPPTARRARRAAPGTRSIGYYFIDTKPIVFWAELGYDFMHDVRRDDALVPGKDGKIPTKTESVHSARAFVGYKNKINAGTAISLALEYLQGLSNTDAYRFNGEMIVSAKLTKTFSLATSFAFRYDHAALPGKEKLDTVTAASLVYSIF